MYRIHLTCPDCGRRFTVDSTTPPAERICPFDHERPIDELRGEERVAAYNDLKARLGR